MPGYLSKLGGGGLGGGQFGGGWLEGVGGRGFPRWGGLHATHYYHMHTSWGDVCLGVWGYGGVYAIMALSHPFANLPLESTSQQNNICIAPRLANVALKSTNVLMKKKY